ncbi:Hypothetical_protein [Hexamita inflata]|uniref:Hypothetical_protein n=1 Tax=Hexamita inflata TaxID=28002 RepID=A0AA86R4Q0_9EUKA|nr:Hypothetical protein HINF_LOCUS54671 [Hexamita inflata]
MNRSHKQLIKSNSVKLCTILEDAMEIEQINSSEACTISDEVVQEDSSSFDSIKTLLTLTAFEMQNVRRRVGQLVFGYDCVKQNLDRLKLAQVKIVDVILGSSDL